jgi:hypothetical protein
MLKNVLVNYYNILQIEQDAYLQTTFMGCFEREEERTGDLVDNTFHG